MQEGIFSHHIVEGLCISFELLVINYSNKMYVKENTSLNQSVISLTNKNRLFLKFIDS
jgi:hypothetical protein